MTCLWGLMESMALIRDFSETCYSILSNEPQGNKFSDEYVKAAIESGIGSLVSSKMKERISEAFLFTMKNKDAAT